MLAPVRSHGTTSAPRHTVCASDRYGSAALNRTINTEHGADSRTDEAVLPSVSLASVTTQFTEIPVESLTLGRFVFTKPRAEAYTQPVGAGGAADTDGLLGNALLTPYRVTFDYAHRALWIEPPPVHQSGGTWSGWQPGERRALSSRLREALRGRSRTH